MLLRTLAIPAAVLLLAACGSGRDVHFVIETNGEARAVDLVLQVDGETRFFDSVDHGHEIIERDLPEGARVSLEASNGGGEGAILLRATVDGCNMGTERCEGAGCKAFIEVAVTERCG